MSAEVSKQFPTVFVAAAPGISRQTETFSKPQLSVL